MNIAYANSAEPPSIVIVVPKINADVELSISEIDDVYNRNIQMDKYFETRYMFYAFDINSSRDYTVHVSSQDENYTLKLPSPQNRYRNVYTLDLKNKTITKGYERPILKVFLIISRVVLTLIIEGFIFYAMGFRLKESWKVFLILNLITQGGLNIWLSTFNLFDNYGIIIALFLAEVVIFIIEAMVMISKIKEKNKIIVFVYTFLANTLSLILGGYLISWLPL